MNWPRIELLTTLFPLACPVCLLTAAEFNIVVLDSPGVGFRDTTPVDPVGDNPGTTLGEQRLNVLQRAGDIWSAYLVSDVPITVQAFFYDYGGSEQTGAVLAGARAIDIESGFANAPVNGIWYPVALANSLAGEDLQPTRSDIEVQVNTAIDRDGLFGGWYYGYDGMAEDQLDLFDVLLHELGHGLGVISFVNVLDGAYELNTADVFSLNLYDTEKAEGWDTMNRNERKSSIINDPDLVWSGPYTTAAASRFLDNPVVILVESPVSLAGEYACLPGQFSPEIPDGGIRGTLVFVDDGTGVATDACEPILNGAGLAGNIAYIDRGTCNFDTKVLAAQNAGAIAVIIANNQAGGPMGMEPSGTFDTSLLTIPAVSISLDDGLALKGAEGPVTLTFGAPGSSGLAGTSQGYLRMYAPNPVERGSSVSHFTPEAEPDLLMEPFITPGRGNDLDLSLTLLKDIGWQVVDIPYPYLDYNLWVGETFDPADTLTGQVDDPDLDGLLNIEEYFFGGNPLVASTDVLPRMEAGNSDAELVYQRSTLGTDLSYAYEVSSGTSGWSDAVEGLDYTEEVITGINSSTEEVRLKLVPPTPGGRVFVRLRITIP